MWAFCGGWASPIWKTWYNKRMKISDNLSPIIVPHLKDLVWADEIIWKLVPHHCKCPPLERPGSQEDTEVTDWQRLGEVTQEIGHSHHSEFRDRIIRGENLTCAIVHTLCSFPHIRELPRLTEKCQCWWQDDALTSRQRWRSATLASRRWATLASRPTSRERWVCANQTSRHTTAAPSWPVLHVLLEQMQISGFVYNEHVKNISNIN